MVCFSSFFRFSSDKHVAHVKYIWMCSKLLFITHFAFINATVRLLLLVVVVRIVFPPTFVARTRLPTFAQMRVKETTADESSHVPACTTSGPPIDVWRHEIEIASRWRSVEIVEWDDMSDNIFSGGCWLLIDLQFVVVKRYEWRNETGRLAVCPRGSSDVQHKWTR